jgi:hypothetical protein
LPQLRISEQNKKMPESLAKQGISRHKGAKHNYDKNTFRLPRQHLSAEGDMTTFGNFL